MVGEKIIKHKATARITKGFKKKKDHSVDAYLYDMGSINAPSASHFREVISAAPEMNCWERFLDRVGTSYGDYGVR